LIDKIILIDNGSDNTPDLLKKKGYLENSRIQYTFAENTGGAGGFMRVKRAYEAGYWLWLMDDDAEPQQEDALEKLSEYLSEPNVSASKLKVDHKRKLYTHLGFFNSKDKFDFEAEIFRGVEDKAIKESKVLEIAYSSFVEF